MRIFEELKSKFDFWYAKKFFVLDKAYSFMLDVSNPNSLSVKLHDKYEGVVISYDNITVSEENTLQFDFILIANPNNADTTSESFKRFILNVFRSIIANSVHHAENSNEDRKFDPSESNQERAVHEESSTLFEERVPERKPRKKAVRGSKKVRSKV